MYKRMYLMFLVLSTINILLYRQFFLVYAADKNSCDGSCGGACAGGCSRHFVRAEQSTDEDSEDKASSIDGCFEEADCKGRQKKEKEKVLKCYDIQKDKGDLDGIRREDVERGINKRHKKERKEAREKDRKARKEKKARKDSMSSEERGSEEEKCRVVQKEEWTHFINKCEEIVKTSSRRGKKKADEEDEKSSRRRDDMLRGMKKRQKKERREARDKDRKKRRANRRASESSSDGSFDEFLCIARQDQEKFNRDKTPTDDQKESLEDMKKRHKKERKDARKKDRENREKQKPISSSLSSQDGGSEEERCKRIQEEELNQLRESHRKSKVKHTRLMEDEVCGVLVRHKKVRKESRARDRRERHTRKCKQEEVSSDDGGSEEFECEQDQHIERKKITQALESLAQEQINKEDDDSDCRTSRMLLSDALSGMLKRQKKERKKARKRDRENREIRPKEPRCGSLEAERKYQEENPESSESSGSEEERCKARHISERVCFAEEYSGELNRKLLRGEFDKQYRVKCFQDRMSEKMIAMNKRHKTERREAKAKDRKKKGIYKAKSKGPEGKDRVDFCDVNLLCGAFQSKVFLDTDQSEEEVEEAVECLVFQFEEEGEPPDNNESVPPFLFNRYIDGDIEDDEEENGEDIDIEKGKKHYKRQRKNVEVELDGYTSDAHKESISSLQKIVHEPINDVYSALSTLDFEIQSVQLNKDKMFHMFASVQGGTKQASSRFGICMHCIERVQLGVAYSFAKHDRNVLFPSLKFLNRKEPLGYVESKLENYSFSCAVCINPKNPGPTVLLEGLYGAGKVRVSRHSMFEGIMHATYGVTPVKTKAFYSRLGYTLRIPRTLVTPYIGYARMYGNIDSYSEHKGYPLAYIGINRIMLTEYSLGMKTYIHIINKVSLEVSMKGSRVKRSVDSLFSALKSLHTKYCVKVPGRKEIYTQGEIDISLDVGITDNFGMGFSTFIRNKAHPSIEKSAVTMRLWYNY